MKASRASSATVLAAIAVLASAAALAIATTADLPEAGCRGAPAVEIVEPPASDPFAAMSAMRMVPVTAQRTGVIDHEHGMVFETKVSALDPLCEEDYCREGCFEFVAIAQSDTLEDIEIRVATLDEPTSWIAMNTAPGPAVTGGFCFHFRPGGPGALELRVETLARSGQGPVAVQGWLEPLSEHTIDEPPVVGEPITGELLPTNDADPPEAGRVRFMASDPHVPLAEVWLGDLQAPPLGACQRWPAQRHRWVALDAWGQIVGTHERTRAEGYDVTGCYEMETKTIRGDSGVGLLASVGYQARARFEASPSAEQRAAFDQFVDELDGVWPTDLERSPMFFRGYDDVLTAAIGGRVLVLAAFVDGAWHLRHIETRFSTEDYIYEPYRLLAVFDLDGDGHAEVVFRESEGPAWNDVVLTPGGTIWDRAATSVGGGTI